MFTAMPRQLGGGRPRTAGDPGPPAGRSGSAARQQADRGGGDTLDAFAAEATAARAGGSRAGSASLAALQGAQHGEEEEDIRAPMLAYGELQRGRRGTPRPLATDSDSSEEDEEEEEDLRPPLLSPGQVAHRSSATAAGGSGQEEEEEDLRPSLLGPLEVAPHARAARCPPLALPRRSGPAADAASLQPRHRGSAGSAAAVGGGDGQQQQQHSGSAASAVAGGEGEQPRDVYEALKQQQPLEVQQQLTVESMFWDAKELQVGVSIGYAQRKIVGQPTMEVEGSEGKGSCCDGGGGGAAVFMPADLLTLPP